MADKSRSREIKTEPTMTHQSSEMSSTQSKNPEKARGDRSDVGGNRPGGQENTTRQSNLNADRDGPSRQTSTAQDEKGQL